MLSSVVIQNAERNMSLGEHIRTIPDYPKPGVLFRDVTTLILDPLAFRRAVLELAESFEPNEIDKVVGIEARGFIFGAAIAYELNVGFVPARKAGKLPSAVYQKHYELEYGSNTLEIHKDAIRPDDKIVVIDDLLATGGSACAPIDLIVGAGGSVIGCGFVAEISDLTGRQRIESKNIAVHVLCQFKDS